MLYLLDANVLIDANRDYYPMERVPEFWEWLLAMGAAGHVKLIIEVYEEVAEGKDALAVWLKDDHVKNTLLLEEEARPEVVSRVVDEGYGPDLTDKDVKKIGRDPFLVACALHSQASRCVVTTEVSKPKATRANRRLPDVCRHFAIDCCNTFEMLRRLDFRTTWRTGA